MAEPLKLMCVLAHPDDESLGMGSTLLKYAREGVEISLVTATRGERGWTGDWADYPGEQKLGQIREKELRCAAEELGIRQVSFLDYIDGDLDRADPAEATARIVTHLRRVRPHVVVTFGPDGGYGHPDHIAICQFTSAALVSAADPAYDPALVSGDAGLASSIAGFASREARPGPHRVSKFYYFVTPKEEIAIYLEHMGDLVMEIDGVERRIVAWEPWAITTRIDTSETWQKAWQAVSCHFSQLPGYGKLSELPEEVHRALWSSRMYYRAYSLVNGGRKLENDLFEGLRTGEEG